MLLLFEDLLMSLPPRERGLKLRPSGLRPSGLRSLPPRERGLKHSSPSNIKGLRLSLPPRERGLKQYSIHRTCETMRVAPPTGAWIETTPTPQYLYGSGCRSPHGSVD